MSYPKRGPSNTTKEGERTAKLGQKKDQLKSLLINKFRGKYQMIVGGDDFDLILKNEVEKFVMQGSMNEAELLRLDKRLAQVFGVNSTNTKRQISTNQRQQQNKSQEQIQGHLSSYLSSSQLKETEQPQSASMSRSSAIRDAGAAILQKKDDEWNKIIVHNVEAYHKEQEDHKQRLKSDQVRMKDLLEKQVVDQKRLKEEEKKREIEYMEKMRNISQQEEMKEKAKHDQMKKKLQQEKQVRDQQLQAIGMKKNEERNMEKQVEEQRRIKMQHEEQQQRERDKQKMEGYKKQCLDSLEENKRLKDLQRQKDQEQRKLAPTGDDLLGQLFKEKKHISYEKRAINDQYVEMMKDMINGNSDPKKKMIDITVEKVQKEREQQLQIEEDSKKQNMKQKQLATKQYLDLQMKEKEEKQKMMKQQEGHDAKAIEERVKSYKDQEQKKRYDQDQVMKNHKQNLQSQIEMNRKNAIGMDQKEFLLNKQLLESIENKSVGSPLQTNIKKPF